MLPGPLPKDPKLRQRRNKVSTAAKLSLEDHGIEAPALPDRVDPNTGEVAPWHPRTVEWWEDVWASPMAPEFLDADVHGLFLLAELEDAFHWSRNPREKMDLAKEIRLQRAMYGLTPMDRRRLQWEVDRGEEAEQRASALARRASRSLMA